MTTARQEAAAAAAGHIPVPVDMFTVDADGNPVEDVNYWILTIQSGFTEQLGDEGRPAVFVVFEEGPQDKDGRTVAHYDMRLSTTDQTTLRRIYGARTEWLGQWVVIEARRQGTPGDGFGEGRLFARVAAPAKWRRFLAEVVPRLNEAGL